MTNEIYYLKRIVSVYCLALTIIGTVGNLFSCYICLRKRLRNITTFKLFAFIAISDMLGLYQWNLHNFFIYYLADFEFVYLWFCKYNTYMQNVTSELSAWLLVSLTFDRLLSIKFRNWSTSYFIKSRVTFYAVCLMLFIFLFNIPIIVYDGYVFVDNNGTENVICYATSENDHLLVDIYAWVFLIIYSILPFLILAVLNVQLIQIVVLNRKKTTTTSKTNSKQVKMSLTIIIITMLFIVFTLPTASIQGNTYIELYSTDLGQLGILLCNAFTFTYQGSNLLMLYSTNKQFAREFKSLFAPGEKFKMESRIKISTTNL